RRHGISSFRAAGRPRKSLGGPARASEARGAVRATFLPAFLSRDVVLIGLLLAKQRMKAVATGDLPDRRKGSRAFEIVERSEVEFHRGRQITDRLEQTLAAASEGRGMAA